MAVFRLSANKIKISEKMSRAFCSEEISKKHAIGAKIMKTSKSSLKAGSDLNIALNPSYE